MNTTFGVTPTTGTRPIAVVAPLCHRRSPTSPVDTGPTRPCNDPRADVVLPPTQEPATALKEDLTAACRGAASPNTVQKASGRDRTATVFPTVPTPGTLPLRTDLTKTSLCTSLIGTSSQGTSLPGTSSQGSSLPGTSSQRSSLLGTSSWSQPNSDLILTFGDVDSAATSRQCCKVDSGWTKDQRRSASVQGLPCSDETLTPDVADGVPTLCQRCKLDSGKTKDRRLSLSPTHQATVNLSPVSVTSSQSGDFLPAVSLELEDYLEAVNQCNFYYGHLTNTEAKSRLHRYSVGTFLLRDSSDARFRYSLSVKTSRGTTSIRIGRTPTGRYRLDSDPHQEPQMPAFRSILSLVEHYFLVASSSSSSPGEKGKHRGHCVLLESSGRYDTPMVLRKPLELSPAPLAHLCRRRINNLAPSAADRRGLIETLAVEVDGQWRRSIQEYLLAYPFRV